MKKKICAFSVMGCLSLSASVSAQWVTVVSDSMANQSGFINNTLKMIWAPNDVVTNGFEIVNKTANSLLFPALRVTELAAANKRYTIPAGLRESTCIDYEFANPISRAEDTIVVELDVTWDERTSGGENDRLVVTLLHDYPKGGAVFNDIDSINKAAPFGRPAYNFRVLNRTQNNNLNALMMYGGGPNVLGQIEKSSSGNGYWLPGFSSGPGGTAPGTEPSPYPGSGTQKYMTNDMSSSTEWMHYTWLIMPERLEVYFRKTGETVTENGGKGKMTMFMQIPKMPADLADTTEVIEKMNTAHGTSITKLPAFYNWFGEIDGLRVFFNGGKTYVTNVTVKHSNHSQTLNESLAQLPQTKPVFYPNPSSGMVYVKNASPGTYMIYSLQGRLLKQGLLDVGNEAIDMTTLTAGMYLLKFQSAEGMMHTQTLNKY